VTLSDGAVALCRSSDGETETRPWSSESTVTTTELATHSLEPWTLAFSPDAELLFSGGDDAVLQALRLPSIDNDAEDDGNAATLLWSDRKSHEGRRKVLAELDLGGGVWRLKMLGERYVISFFSFLFPRPQRFFRGSISLFL
jgi:diphthamide biosynthesis protein 7